MQEARPHDSLKVKAIKISFTGLALVCLAWTFQDSLLEYWEAPAKVEVYRERDWLIPSELFLYSLLLVSAIEYSFILLLIWWRRVPFFSDAKAMEIGVAFLLASILAFSMSILKSSFNAPPLLNDHIYGVFRLVLLLLSLLLTVFFLKGPEPGKF